MRALAIGLVAGAAFCGVASAPASAMPMGNLATAASDLALSTRSLRVQSASMLVAAELRLPPGGLLRLWTELLSAELRAKLLRLWARWVRLRTRLDRRTVWRRSLRPMVVERRPTFCPPARLLP